MMPTRHCHSAFTSTGSNEERKIKSFITSMLELKLDQATMLEWHRHSQDSKDVPPYNDLLEFLDLRALAFKSAIDDSDKRRSRPIEKKNITHRSRRTPLV